MFSKPFLVHSHINVCGHLVYVMGRETVEGSLLRWHDLATSGWGGQHHDHPVPLPTLAGWLLEYPAVYIFHPDRGAYAAGALSSCSLLGYEIWSTSPALQGSQTHGDGLMLMSFSIPSELLSFSDTGEIRAEKDALPKSQDTEIGSEISIKVKQLMSRMEDRSSRSDIVQTRENLISDWGPTRLVTRLHAPHAVAL